MFEWNEEEARLEALHHPFTAPKLEATADPGSARGGNGSLPDLRDATALAYDLVYNGVEIAGMLGVWHGLTYLTAHSFVCWLGRSFVPTFLPAIIYSFPFHLI